MRAVPVRGRFLTPISTYRTKSYEMDLSFFEISVLHIEVPSARTAILDTARYTSSQYVPNPMRVAHLLALTQEDATSLAARFVVNLCE